MQGIADDEEVRLPDLGVELEIRSRWPHNPTSHNEIARLGLQLLEVCRLLRIDGLDGELTSEQWEALADPLAESIVGERRGTYLDIYCRAGVTDVEGEMAARALALCGAEGARCRAGTRYHFASSVPAGRRPAAERLLGNPLIHEFHWSAAADEPSAASPRSNNWGAAAHPIVRTISLHDNALLDISREHHLALDLEEMGAVAAYFQSLGRDPTDAELQSIALTWSEHCSHKTFKADIELEHDGRRETIPGLLKSYLAAGTEQLDRPWVRSAFVDNAGVIAFDRRHDLAIKVETHNHPSALEPYGGAHTGVGGVIRDILAVSADPIANTDVLCFGPTDLPDDAVPAGVWHPRVTYREVVRGVADYGNNMGIPTVGGAVLFHPGYTANPLVFCGTLGIAPSGSHPRQPRPGDTIVLLGGKTGRDGLHGATMSSETLDRESVAGTAVQIGAPITEKTIRDVLPSLRAERLYDAITDCGAGGLCSAVGEMGAELGIDVDLALVPLKYEGLQPWEIWLSEAQERMVLAVPRQKLARVFELCRHFDVAATVIGAFRADGRLRLTHAGTTVADLDMSFLHSGRPQRRLLARFSTQAATPSEPPGAIDGNQTLLRLLAHPNIASKEAVIRRYDHEVGAITIGKPLAGRAGHANAAVLQPVPDNPRGVVVGHGINPLYGAGDPYDMAMLAADEALRNLVAAGGCIDRAALLDNFCWGEVDDPESLGRLVRAVQGCRDAALRYGTPFISGKDSLRNTSDDGAERHSIPDTLLITAVGTIPDATRTVTPDLKEAGNDLYLLGATYDELGGSHLLWTRGETGGKVPRVRPETPRLMRALSRAIRAGVVRACHDVSEGGLAVAAAEMAIGGGKGVTITLDDMPGPARSPAVLAFAESPGRFLIEVRPDQAASIGRRFRGLPCARLGTVTVDGRMRLVHQGEPFIDLTVTELEQAWRGSKNSAGQTAFAQSEQNDHDRRLGSSNGDPAGPSAKRTTSNKGAYRALVLAAAGINCDREAIEACQVAGFRAESVHLNRLVGGEEKLEDFAFLVLPGGFSYGDHLGGGAMLATLFRHRLLDDLQRFVADGRPVLGICNGFQVLARLGFLGDVTLAPNAHGLFECRWVPVTATGADCVFLRDLEEMELPIAHGLGRVMFDREGRAPNVALRYRENPNGSMDDVAGVCNAAGNILGLMPHPERYLRPHHHPAWRRGSSLPPPGLILFANARQYVREAL